jgi:hypothetical protein
MFDFSHASTDKLCLHPLSGEPVACP